MSLSCEVINLGIAQPSYSPSHRVNKEAREVAITSPVSPHGEISVSYGSDEMSLTLKPYAEIKEAHRRVKAREGKKKLKKGVVFSTVTWICSRFRTHRFPLLSADGIPGEGQSNCSIPGN